MDIKILKKLNKTLSNDEIKITIEYNQNNSIYEDIENYLHQYKENNNIIVVKNDYNHLIHLDLLIISSKFGMKWFFLKVIVDWV